MNKDIQEVAEKTTETMTEAALVAGGVGKIIEGVGGTADILWKYGANKSAAKWASQMSKRGWTEQQITEAIQGGEKFSAPNLVNPGNSATRYVHPGTGQSVVVDDVSREVLHVGGSGFGY